LNNYAEQHAIILPRRVSTVYNAKVQLLPSSDIKIKVHEIYKNSYTNEMHGKPVSKKFSLTFGDIAAQKLLS
jgi:hypothetical protein